jgi:hypothetical protein
VNYRTYWTYRKRVPDRDGQVIVAVGSISVDCDATTPEAAEWAARRSAERIFAGMEATDARIQVIPKSLEFDYTLTKEEAAEREANSRERTYFVREILIGVILLAALAAWFWAKGR